MGKMTSVPFALQKGDDGQATQNSKEMLRNMFAEITISGRAHIIRRQRAALRAVYTIAGEKRCIEEFNGLHYVIVGATLYSFDGATLTTLGTLSTATGRCTMAFNNSDQLGISDGTNLYCWDGATLSTTSLPAGVVPGTLSYINGYGVFNQVGTDVFWVTDLNDFKTVDPLNFATAESNPDALQTTFVDHNELWLVGTKTTEIWQDVGGTDFPFQAVTSAKIERGTAAPLSMAADDNTVISLGNDGIVYRYEGYRPARISTTPVEASLRKCTSAGRANAYALIYTIDGNKFYTLTVPGEWTGQYNFASGLWNEANTYGYLDWRVIGSAGHDASYVLTTTGIAALDPDLNQDEGGIIVRLARSATGHADGARISLKALHIDCQVGRVGSPTLEPLVMIRIARDGETFGNTLNRSLGSQGNYKKRVIRRSMGQARKPVIEVSMSDDCNFTIMGTELLASVASS